MEIGERVIFITLLKKGDFPGEIIDIGLFGKTCTVKLDSQFDPVSQVIYFPSKPTEVNSTVWQICYPANEELVEL